MPTRRTRSWPVRRQDETLSVHDLAKSERRLALELANEKARSRASAPVKVQVIIGAKVVHDPQYEYEVLALPLVSDLFGASVLAQNS